MDNYAIMIRRKIKSEKEMDSSYKHNERIYDVANADPEQKEKNEELMDSYGEDYTSIFHRTLAELKSLGVPQRKVRSDAVLGFEVMLTFSRERMGDIDMDEWKAANLEWLDKTFNPENHEIRFTDRKTGEEKTAVVQNIKHVILHLDESNPHIHAFIVPIDGKGALNAHAYDRGRSHLRQMQSDYAKAMERFGLERGEFYSVATQEQRSRYYGHLIKAVETRLPEPEKGESIDDYRTRCEEVYQTALSNHRNDIVKKDQEIVHVRSASKNREYDLKKEMREDKETLDAIAEELGEGPERTPGFARRVVEDVKETRDFQEAVDLHPDRDLAEQARTLHEQMLDWYRETVRKKEAADRRRAERDAEKGSPKNKPSSGGSRRKRKKESER